MTVTNKTMDDGELYSRVTARREFDRWCKKGGWDGADDFERKTGVSFDTDLKGKWFFVTHNRVFTMPQKPRKEPRRYTFNASFPSGIAEQFMDFCRDANVHAFCAGDGCGTTEYEITSDVPPGLVLERFADYLKDIVLNAQY